MSIHSDHHQDKVVDETTYPAIITALVLFAFAGVIIYLQMF